MFDIGSGELLLILIAVLVFFGPKKMPELARSVGRGMREFKRAQREFTDQINSAFSDEESRQRGNVARRTISRAEPPRVELKSQAETSVDPATGVVTATAMEGFGVPPAPVSSDANGVEPAGHEAVAEMHIDEASNDRTTAVAPSSPSGETDSSPLAGESDDRPSAGRSDAEIPVDPIDPPPSRPTQRIGDRRSRDNREV